jgi:hypothetical protein
MNSQVKSILIPEKSSDSETDIEEEEEPWTLATYEQKESGDEVHFSDESSESLSDSSSGCGNQGYPFIKWNDDSDNSDLTDEEADGWWQFEVRPNPFRTYYNLPSRLRSRLEDERQRRDRRRYLG